MIIMYKKIKIKLICECIVNYSFMIAIELHFVITYLFIPFQKNINNRDGCFYYRVIYDNIGCH